MSEEVKSNATLKTIPLDKIHDNVVALRTVDRKSEKYQGLVESIRQKGFIGAISVKSQFDSDTGEENYVLVDGLHRTSAAKDAGLTEINANILDVDEAGVLETQIMMNCHKVETKPHEYAKQLQRLLAMNQFMTVGELAKNLGNSKQWIQKRLGLTKVTDAKIAKLIDDGEICLSNAYALSKLPAEEQADWVQRAMTEEPSVFVDATVQRAKEIKEARRTGKAAPKAEFKPVAHMQKLGVLKKELEDQEISRTLIATHQPKTVHEAFRLAVQWVLHLDPTSVQIQKANFDQKVREKAEAKKRKAEEKAAKQKEKAEEAAKRAAAAAAELDLAFNS